MNDKTETMSDAIEKLKLLRKKLSLMNFDRTAGEVGNQIGDILSELEASQKQFDLAQQPPRGGEGLSRLFENTAAEHGEAQESGGWCFNSDAFHEFCNELAQPRTEQPQCRLGCTDTCKAEAHGAPSECPDLTARPKPRTEQAAAQAVATYMGKRLTPAGTKEFWGWLAEGVDDLPPVTKLYTSPPRADADRAMRALDASIIREASDVLEAVGVSGVPLPNNWRWPLADELHGIAASLSPINQPKVVNTNTKVPR